MMSMIYSGSRIARDSRYRGFILASLILVGLAFGTTPAQDPEVNRRLHPSGTFLFRGMLESVGLQARLPEDFDLLPAHQVLFVMFGISEDLPDSELYQRIARRTLDGGGAVLLIGENGSKLDGFFPKRTGLSISRGKVYSLNPRECFDNYPGSPYPVVKQPDYPGMGNLQHYLPRTATNHPAALTLTHPSDYASTVLAGFPRHCRLETDTRRLADNQGFLIVGSGAESDSSFRCAILSDPSVLTNQMLAIADPAGSGPQNLVFAYELIRWLQSPSSRTYCIFIDYGRPRDQFYPLIPEPPLPIPPLPNPLNPALQSRITTAINDGLTGLEDRDVMNRRLVGEPGERQRFFAFLRTAAVLTAGLALLMILYRIWAARQKPESLHQPPAGAHPPHALGFADADRQQFHLTEATRVILHELFVSQGADLRDMSGPRPRITVTGKNHRVLKRNIRYLWNLMRDSRSVVMISQKDLESMIVSVWNAAHEGRWQFVTTGGTQ